MNKDIAKSFSEISKAKRSSSLEEINKIDDFNKLVEKAMEIDPYPYRQYADEASFKNKDFVISVIRNTGELLKYASKDWVEYKELVISAIKRDPFRNDYIEYLDPNWDEYDELIEYCNKYIPNRLWLISKEKNPEKYKKYVIKAIHYNYSYISYADPKWDEYKELVRYTIFEQKAYSNIHYADIAWEEYSGWAYAAIAHHYTDLTYISCKWAGYKDLLDFAIKKWGAGCLFYVSRDWEHYKDFIATQIKNGVFSKYEVFRVPCFSDAKHLTKEGIDYIYDCIEKAANNGYAGCELNLYSYNSAAITTLMTLLTENGFDCKFQNKTLTVVWD